MKRPLRRGGSIRPHRLFVANLVRGARRPIRHRAAPEGHGGAQFDRSERNARADRAWKRSLFLAAQRHTYGSELRGQSERQSCSCTTGGGTGFHARAILGDATQRFHTDLGASDRHRPGISKEGQFCCCFWCHAPWQCVDGDIVCRGDVELALD
jgi:hypothetical protein